MFLSSALHPERLSLCEVGPYLTFSIFPCICFSSGLPPAATPAAAVVLYPCARHASRLVLILATGVRPGDTAATGRNHALRVHRRRK